jgi:hypothetical protein
MADQFLKKSLVAELDRSRSQFSKETAHLRDDLAFGRKLKHGVARNPAVWIGGAVVLGLLLSRLPPRQKRSVKIKTSRGGEEAAQAGLAAVVILPTLKFLFSAMQPALTAWVSRQAFGRTRNRRD